MRELARKAGIAFLVTAGAVAIPGVADALDGGNLGLDVLEPIAFGAVAAGLRALLVYLPVNDG